MQKKKTYRSKKYMDFVKTLNCCVEMYFTGGSYKEGKQRTCSEEVHAHHTGKGGVAIKPPDLNCIPLCGLHHNFIHQHGPKTLESNYNIEISLEIIKANQAYIEHLEGKK